MPGRRSARTRAMAMGIAATLLGVVAAIAPAAPAAAAAGITVTPSTNLTDGQLVTVAGTGFPQFSTLNIGECPSTAQTPFDCQLLTFLGAGTTGAFSQDVHVSRYLDLGANGIVDCASDNCFIGTTDLVSTTATQPVTFAATTLPADFAIALGGANIDATGRVTASADVTCNASKSVALTFDVATASKTGENRVVFPCVTGTTVHAISDDIGSGFTPGPMTLQVVARGGTYPVQAKGTVALLSTADAQAAFIAALQGPNGAQVFAQVFTDLRFRLLYNPVFAHEFFVALLQAMHS